MSLSLDAIETKIGELEVELKKSGWSLERLGEIELVPPPTTNRVRTTTSIVELRQKFALYMCLTGASAKDVESALGMKNKDFRIACTNGMYAFFKEFVPKQNIWFHIPRICTTDLGCRDFAPQDILDELINSPDMVNFDQIDRSALDKLRIRYPNNSEINAALGLLALKELSSIKIAK